MFIYLTKSIVGFTVIVTLMVRSRIKEVQLTMFPVRDQIQSWILQDHLRSQQRPVLEPGVAGEGISTQQPAVQDKPEDMEWY